MTLGHTIVAWAIAVARVLFGEPAHTPHTLCTSVLGVCKKERSGER